eukprot:TRINITY_DN60046_c0_g1_i1.p1 TRINITY_DN60046_c0_g1~~TRINITY_DN60046_c0_g1_i1.p1  ORF type:complete len:578 (-),score=102.17 TRINITY_DN60046_c0_g1_i1:76-1809(-)
MAHVSVSMHGMRALLFHLTLIVVLQYRAHSAKLLDASSLAHRGTEDQSSPHRNVPQEPADSSSMKLFSDAWAAVAHHWYGATSEAEKVPAAPPQRMSSRSKLLQNMHNAPAPPKVAETGSMFLNWPRKTLGNAWASTMECWHGIQEKMRRKAEPAAANKDLHKGHAKAPESSSRRSEFFTAASSAVRGVAERLGFVGAATRSQAQNKNWLAYTQNDGFQEVREILHNFEASGAKSAKTGAAQHDSSEEEVERSVDEQNKVKALAKRSRLPEQGRVAIIVRGRAFRGGRFTTGCMMSAWQSQKKETKSLMAKVVDPLLDRGNSVDMFISESSGKQCALGKDLMALYGSFAPPPSIKHANAEPTLGDMYTSQRPASAEPSHDNLLSLFATTPPPSQILVETQQALLSDMYTQERTALHKQRAALRVFQQSSPRSISQRAGLIAALSFFKQKAKQWKHYDLILVIRHDLLWKQAIDEWNVTADYTKLNFMSKCEKGTKIPHCVNDMAFTFPGSMYDGFENSIGRMDCFNQTQCINRGMCHGHGCKEVMMNLTGTHDESYLTQWVPKSNLRERSNPIAILR